MLISNKNPTETNRGHLQFLCCWEQKVERESWQCSCSQTVKAFVNLSCALQEVNILLMSSCVSRFELADTKHNTKTCNLRFNPGRFYPLFCSFFFQRTTSKKKLLFSHLLSSDSCSIIWLKTDQMTKWDPKLKTLSKSLPESSSLLPPVEGAVPP